jgi:hypothetical protein
VALRLDGRECDGRPARARTVARSPTTDQIAFATLLPPSLLLMNDETPDVDKVRTRRQPRVPVTLALFLASIVGFMLVVTGLFAFMRYLGKH